MKKLDIYEGVNAPDKNNLWLNQGIIKKFGPNGWESLSSSGQINVDSTLSLTSVNPVQNKVITEAINKINEKVFPLTLSVTGGGTYQKGTIQDIVVRWTVKQGEDIVIPDTIKVNGVLVTNTDTSKTFRNVNTTTTYAVEVSKNGITKSASTSITFVNPSYYSVVSNTFVANETNIKLLKTNLKTTKAYTATGLNLNNQKICYAYPKSFGALTTIKDGNGFENINSYTRSEITINGELYYVYVLTTATTINNLKQVYN